MTVVSFPSRASVGGWTAPPVSGPENELPGEALRHGGDGPAVLDVDVHDEWALRLLQKLLSVLASEARNERAVGWNPRLCDDVLMAAGLLHHPVIDDVGVILSREREVPGPVLVGAEQDLVLVAGAVWVGCDGLRVQVRDPRRASRRDGRARGYVQCAASGA